MAQAGRPAWSSWRALDLSHGFCPGSHLPGGIARDRVCGALWPDDDAVKLRWPGGLRGHACQKDLLLHDSWDLDFCSGKLSFSKKLIHGAHVSHPLFNVTLKARFCSANIVADPQAAPEIVSSLSRLLLFLDME